MGREKCPFHFSLTENRSVKTSAVRNKSIIFTCLEQLNRSLGLPKWKVNGLKESTYVTTSINRIQNNCPEVKCQVLAAASMKMDVV